MGLGGYCAINKGLGIHLYHLALATSNNNLIDNLVTGDHLASKTGLVDTGKIDKAFPTLSCSVRKAKTAPAWAMPSTMSTPGITGSTGKCP